MLLISYLALSYEIIKQNISVAISGFHFQISIVDFSFEKTKSRFARRILFATSSLDVSENQSGIVVFCFVNFLMQDIFLGMLMA